ncbi:MAG: DUF2723 domain-containing protein [Bacteroidia bacterium]|nr:DUF2723 domain-containing protein [Bacteroidia bacterium]
MPKNYKILNNVTGWLVFIIASATYLLTIEPTASFWDCGEYIACANKLEVGHPPGAPFFLLMGRLFILLGGNNPATAAKWVNIMSALCSSFTILFLYFSITKLGVKIVKRSQQQFTTGRQLAVIFSGVVGGLAYTFSDSFWFSAVEGEVYAMSSLFTAIAFWAILKWDEEADNPSSVRWLIFIAYLIGLSIGVHLLNLLVIPAVCFIFYFRKYKFKFWSFLLTGVISIVLLGGIQGLLIPKIVKFSADTELLFTNKFLLPFNTGTCIYFGLLLLTLCFGIFYAVKKHKALFIAFVSSLGLLALLIFLSGIFHNSPGSFFGRIIVVGGIVAGLVLLKKRPKILHHILVAFTLLLMGYSTYFVLIIRSQANTPMDENNPDNAISMLSYLNREQYGDWPIAYGPYYNAKLDAAKPYLDGNPIYTKNENAGRYEIKDSAKASIPNFDSEYCTVFPRMWSRQDMHERFYRKFHDTANGEIPTFKENLSYFFKYQLNHMYWRYFGWNFVGRQNDVQGMTSMAFDGNVISGYDALDNKLLGIKENMIPVSNKNNKGTNKFYFLPLILGLIGLVFHIIRNPKDFFVCLLLFFFTGIAIVIYLNQYPFQPRERDYAYAGSFYPFAFWIGLSVLAISELFALIKKIPSAIPAAIAFLLCIPVTILMGAQGWDDHDRSKRSMARDFAMNYLQSCEKNAILFTNGDNDTFPLWYLQETEGIRTDVRVINLSLFQMDWNIDQQRRAAYDSPPVPFTLSPDKYAGPKRDQVLFRDDHVGQRTLKEVMAFVASEDLKNKIPYGGRYYDYIPTQQLRIPVDSAAVLKMPGLILPGMENRITNIDWTITKEYLLKNDLMVMDLLAAFDWKRPVYFVQGSGPDNYLELQEYLQMEGLAYRLVPIKSKPEEMTNGARVRVATEIMYKNIFEKPFCFGGLNKPGVYLDETSMRMAQSMRMQMVTLASVLIEEGKTDKAKKVLDKMLFEIPESNVPLEVSTYYHVQCRYQLTQQNEANELANKLFANCESDLTAYLTLGGNDQLSYEREMQQCLGVMDGLAKMAAAYGQKTMAEDFERRISAFK